MTANNSASGTPASQVARSQTIGRTVPAIPAGDRLLEKLYYGSFRRPVRGVLNRVLGESTRIVRGPLKGCRLSAGGSAYLLGVYELPVVYAMLDAVVSGDVVYDVGAHEGYFSLLAGRKTGPNGFVYAFEPLQENAEKVAAHLAENSMGQSMVVPCAVLDRAGTVPMSVSDAAMPSVVGSTTKTITVSATTLDEFAAQHRPPSVIKMDIEGAEALALDGARRVLSERIAKTWIVEIHGSDLDRAVSERFQSAGYALSKLPARIRPDKAYPCHLIANRINTTSAPGPLSQHRTARA